MCACTFLHYRWCHVKQFSTLGELGILTTAMRRNVLPRIGMQTAVGLYAMAMLSVSYVCVHIPCRMTVYQRHYFSFLILMKYQHHDRHRFLANVNSCSCSLYVVVRPSVCLSSVTFVHPTQATEIFGNVSTPFGTVAICNLSIKILRRSSQGNLSGEGLNQRGAAKYSDFGPFQGYISETVQDRS